jgi:hypothetical protein
MYAAGETPSGNNYSIRRAMLRRSLGNVLSAWVDRPLSLGAVAVRPSDGRVRLQAQTTGGGLL